MADKREYSRVILKRTNAPGATPSVPTYSTIENFIPTDIFEGELFYNIPDKKLYTRSDDEIVLLTSAGGLEANKAEITTIDAGTVSLFEIPIPDYSTTTIECNIQAIDTDGTWCYNSKLFGTFYKRTGTITKLSTHGDFLAENYLLPGTMSTVSSGLDVFGTASTAVVQVRVSGEVGLTFSWVGNIDYNTIQR